MGLKSRLFNPLAQYYGGLTKTKLAMPSSSLIIPDQFVGIELELENLPRSLLITKPPTGWVTKADGSLRGSSTEYVSDGPVCGEQLIDSLSALSSLLTQHNCSVERNATFRTSTHVHLDFTRQDNYVNMPSDTYHGAQQTVLLYWLLEDLFFAVAGEHRKRSGFSFQYDDAPGDLARFFGSGSQYTVNDAHRYYGLNFRSLSKFGTLEFRHMPLMVDQSKILKWIRTLMRLKLWAYLNLREDTDKVPRFDMTQSAEGIHEAAEFIMQEYPEALTALDMAVVERRVEEMALWQEIATDNSDSLSRDEEEPHSEDEDREYQEPPAPVTATRRTIEQLAEASRRSLVESMGRLQAEASALANPTPPIPEASGATIRWRRDRPEDSAAAHGNPFFSGTNPTPPMWIGEEFDYLLAPTRATPEEVEQFYSMTPASEITFSEITIDAPATASAPTEAVPALAATRPARPTVPRHRPSRTPSF